MIKALLTMFISLGAHAGSEFQAYGQAMIPVESCDDDTVGKMMSRVVMLANLAAKDIATHEFCDGETPILVHENYINITCLPISDGWWGKSLAIGAGVMPTFRCNQSEE